MTIRPILFSGPMVRALLDGRKTQTRRVLKPTDDTGTIHAPDTPYASGDLLYVRECFTLTQHEKAVYRADATDQTEQRWSTISPGDPDNEVLWKPSIHMPRWASRLTLKVNDVRVQRLQEINDGDAAAEGVQAEGEWPLKGAGRLENFERLWNNLNEKRGFGWASNPWIVALIFSVHRVNVDQLKDEVAA